MYAMVDCNAFYCSCERLFDPSIANRPVIVLSNNDGCAVARSDEAKALGIEMGTPGFMIAEMIRQHNVAVFSSNYTLYQDISDRVMQTLGSSVPGIEVYSIDEAFLDLHDMPYHDLLALAVDIRKRVFRDIGIPVSVGVASTKTLAKMANRFAKKWHKDVGVFYAANEALTNEMLERTKVREVWGIGKQHTELLERNGVATAADLAAASDDWIRKHLSVVGLRMVYELRGIPSIPWQPVLPNRKNICTSRSFGELVTNVEVLAEAASNHAASCALKLRAQRTAAGTVHVFLQTNPHRTHDKQFARSVNVRLATAANDTSTIIKAALDGLFTIWSDGYRYKKVGVVVMDLVPESAIQQDLFHSPRKTKVYQLMKTIDSINGVKGKDTVRMGAQLGEKNYRLRAEHLSRHYTTNINELPETG